jgi:Family of unknown function (DUF6338)
VNVDLVQAALFLAPGFLALKIFYLFGAQRPRSQWEWTTWSIVASLPLNGIAALAAAALGRVAIPGPVPPVTSTTSTWQADAASVAFALFLATISGAVLALAWRTVRASDGKRATWLRRELTDSAWDQALEDAHFKERAIVVVMDDGTRYRGKLKYGGREDAQAAGWMYLHWPGKRDEKTQEWVRLRGTHGLLIERSKIRLVQVYLTKTERVAEAADDAITLAGTNHVEN